MDTAEATAIIRAVAQRVSSPVLVGRRDELALLRAGLERASTGVAGCILVAGEAGIGKTRLVTELTEGARADGALVLEGACVSLGSDEAVPFAPIAGLLRSLVRAVGRARLTPLLDESTVELGRLVPELGRAPDDGSLSTVRPEWAQTRFYEGFLTLLARLAADAPVVLVIEDLHWADRSTRELLSFLARNARTERALVVGTYRTDELHRRHPLRPWLAEMERVPRVERVDLRRFDRDELRMQLEAILDAVPSGPLLDTIERRSAGNPFFAEELVAAALEHGDDRLPVELRDLLLARATTLSEIGRAVLERAAVAGPWVAHEVLHEVSGVDEDVLTAGIREAVEAHLLVPLDADGVPGYAFRHALLQEAIYDDLLPRERRAHHAAFCRALSSRSVPDGAAAASQLAALAHHATAAHELASALRAWLEAARAASRALALAEAARAYERAMDLWDAVPADDRPTGVDVVDVLYEASMAFILSADPARAATIARTAVERFDPSTDVLRAAQLRERLGRALWLTAELPDAIAVLEEAVEMLRGQPASPEFAQVLSGFAGTLMLKGELRRAAAYAEQAVDMAREVGVREVEAYAKVTLGVAIAIDESDAALRLLRSGLAMTRDLGRPHDLHRAFCNLSTILLDCGQLPEAAAVALEGVEWARRSGMLRLQGAFLQGNAAEAFLELGEWDRARELLDRSDGSIPSGVARLNDAITGGPLAVWSGDLARAHETFDGVRGAVDRLGDSQFTGPLYVGLIELALAEGRLADARALGIEVAARLANSDDHRRVAELCALRVRTEVDLGLAARRERDAARLDEATRNAHAGLASLRASLSAFRDERSTLARIARAFLATAEADISRLDDTNDPAGWQRAVEAWTALGRPFRIARCQYHYAQALLTTRGSRAAAADALAGALDVAQRLGAAPLVRDIEGLARAARLDLAARARPDVPSGEAEPARGSPADRADRPYGLTERELEVLNHLVAGRSNREIGELLFISESTAGVHVSNILGKLGVSGRVEAAAVAVRAGIAD